jgi:hypothetical protein
MASGASVDTELPAGTISGGAPLGGLGAGLPLGYGLAPLP